ncbi:hypothetical protein NKCBBBOE_02444 [Pseudarthrobacter sp. MM222]|nr:hypothetical protein NKCBBBOE_02444 [Pseudarthrobacter sp. MM222]
MAGFADEGALELAEQFLGGFGAVLVDCVGPAPGDADEEVGVVFGRGPGQGMFHPRRGLDVAGVPDPVQRDGDDARGPGRDLGGRDRGAELLPDRRQQLLAAEPGPWQQVRREGEPAPCFRGADPQPGPQELRGIPVPVIHGLGVTPGLGTIRGGSC